MVLCFPVRRDAPVLADGAGSGVVRRESEFRRAERPELHQEITDAAVEVLDRITGIDAKKARGGGHQLCQTDCTGRGIGADFEVALDLDHRMEKTVPMTVRETDGPDRGMRGVTGRRRRDHCDDRRCGLSLNQQGAYPGRLVFQRPGKVRIVFRAGKYITGSSRVQNKATVR